MSKEHISDEYYYYDSGDSAPRVLGLGVVGCLAAAALIWANWTNSDGISKAEEKATEGCVAALVGHEVNLVPNADASGLDYPAGVREEQIACEDADNNIAQARVYLGN